MRWRVFALVSLGVNIILAAVWLFSWRHSAARGGAAEGLEQASAGQTRTNIVLRRQFFSWQEVESADYPTYIANLRYIGCPEQTIRDIIIADVNALYARKRATEMVTPDQQWWRPEPDTNVVQVAAEKSRALEDERRTLLTRLLGQNWESGDIVSLPRPTRPGIVLDGPVLGTLQPEIKQAVQEANIRSEERLQAYLDAQRREGKTADPVELAKLRQQTREELARVLAPPQLEEYLLRYSEEATSLRNQLGQLRFFDASPEEFRAMFRAQDTIDQQLQLLSGNDPNSIAQRKALEDQRDNAVKIALGPKRYEEYQLLHDPLYRDAVASAEEAGTPEAARTIYQINLAAAASQEAIRARTNLTPSQRIIELKQLEVDQLKANTVATGQELPPEPAPAPPPPRTYTLRPGDSPSVVSMIYGVPVSAIQAANPGVDISRLKPGDPIIIPRSAPAPTGGSRIPSGGP